MHPLTAAGGVVRRQQLRAQTDTDRPPRAPLGDERRRPGDTRVQDGVAVRGQLRAHLPRLHGDRHPLQVHRRHGGAEATGPQGGPAMNDKCLFGENRDPSPLFAFGTYLQLHTCNPIQGWGKMWAPGLVKFAPAVAYHFCPN